MTRISAALAFVAAIALPIGAMAQTTAAPAPKTATVNDIVITSVTATPVAPGSRVPETRDSLLGKLRDSVSVTPKINLPPATNGGGNH
jgi:hypothetical protein